MVQVRRATVGETYDIRLKVLRINGSRSHKFQGDLDGDTFHFGAFENIKLLAVASFVKSTHPLLKGTQCQFRGMAILESFLKSNMWDLML